MTGQAYRSKIYPTHAAEAIEDHPKCQDVGTDTSPEVGGGDQREREQWNSGGDTLVLVIAVRRLLMGWMDGW